MQYDKLVVPQEGKALTVRADGSLDVPDRPIIPYIEGDGTGPDIWQAARRVLDAAVQRAFAGKRQLLWWEVFAGEKALRVYGPEVWLPADTIKAIQHYGVAIKGPLTTPVSGGIRSINVALRQQLDLYSCERPVRWFQGVPAPVKEPQKLQVKIFRQNDEDVYAGIEFKAGSTQATRLIAYLNNELLQNSGKVLRADAGIGIKPCSEFGSKRLVRRALQYAVANRCPSLTLVHKGNIMKFTEGAFCTWGYEVAKQEFADHIVTEADVATKFAGVVPQGKLLVKDRIADAMFQQILLRPDEYSVIATTNLNGDYLSDACAAQVGGLGLAPGANIGDRAAVFEATHGTAPKYAGQDKVNPGSVILSGAMLLRHLGWGAAADCIERGLERSIADKTVTYDLERQMPGAKLTSCSGFAHCIINNMG